jgi:hypothetical protein
MVSNFKPLLLNQRRSAYRKNNDILTTKTETYINDHYSFISDLTVEFYINISGEWDLVASGVTNEYGMCYLNYQSVDPFYVDNCLGATKVYYQGSGIYSNLVRFNFRS